MSREYFTKQEAHEKVGKIIEAKVPFSDVPGGTGGTVTRADQSEGENWTVAIQWHLPTKRPSVTPGQIGEDDFVVIETGNPLVDWFSKSEYERYLRELA